MTFDFAEYLAKAYSSFSLPHAIACIRSQQNAEQPSASQYSQKHTAGSWRAMYHSLRYCAKHSIMHLGSEHYLRANRRNNKRNYITILTGVESCWRDRMLRTRGQLSVLSSSYIYDQTSMQSLALSAQHTTDQWGIDHGFYSQDAWLHPFTNKCCVWWHLAAAGKKGAHHGLQMTDRCLVHELEDLTLLHCHSPEKVTDINGRAALLVQVTKVLRDTAVNHN